MLTLLFSPGQADSFARARAFALFHSIMHLITHYHKNELMGKKSHCSELNALIPQMFNPQCGFAFAASRSRSRFTKGKAKRFLGQRAFLDFPTRAPDSPPALPSPTEYFVAWRGLITPSCRFVGRSAGKFILLKRCCPSTALVLSSPFRPSAPSFLRAHLGQ